MKKITTDKDIDVSGLFNELTTVLHTPLIVDTLIGENGTPCGGVIWVSEESDYTVIEKIIEAHDPVKYKISQEWSVIRVRRDQLLSSCDWTQMPDSPLTPEEKRRWAAYRQALRDLPNKCDMPSSVVWPTSPDK